MPSDERGQREGLGHDESADQALPDDDDAQRRARRPEVGKDPGVERPHTGSSASVAVGMWCTAMRLRNTQ